MVAAVVVMVGVVVMVVVVAGVVGHHAACQCRRNYTPADWKQWLVTNRRRH